MIMMVANWTKLKATTLPGSLTHVQCVGQPQCNEDIRQAGIVCLWLFLVSVSACRFTIGDSHPRVVQNNRTSIF